MDQNFSSVISHCSSVPRPGQEGTWITQSMVDAYKDLHAAGYAHSVEAWDNDSLVGGFYGVSIGKCFFGESMFAQKADASKIAFATFITQLAQWDFKLIDCQVHTEHMERFGGVFWSREQYCATIAESQKASVPPGPWEIQVQPFDAFEYLKG